MKKVIILGLSIATLSLFSCANDNETAGEKLDQAIENTKDAGQELKEDAQQVGNNIEAGAENAAQETKEALNNAGEAIKDGAQKAAAETKEAVNKTGEAIKDGAKEVKKDIHNATK